MKKLDKDKRFKRTTFCGNCPYRGIDGGPSPIMVCNAPGAPNGGYIIEMEAGEAVSYQCPLGYADE